MKTSNNGGVDWIGHKVRNDDDTGLSQEEAREQLLWELRNQLGEITFTVEEDDSGRGDGIVIANINGQQADHYIYHDNE